MEKYSKLKQRIRENLDTFDVDNGCSLENLLLAEKELGLTFPEDYRQFLLDFANLAAGPHEIYGIIENNFYGKGIPNGIWLTLSERKEFNLPSYLIVVSDGGLGDYFCLNYKKLNAKGVPMVTSYYPGYDESVQTHEVIAESFEDFLEQIVNETLEDYLDN
ncbi:MAG: SMI1/KNR4 family protein [Aerococcaceae bacterium]|nr:SMI1/KNR4 family protein [Aerococcaceae bacterium]